MLVRSWRWISRNTASVFILGILFGIFVASLWWSVILNNGTSADWLSGFWQNFSTEVLGAILTFVLFELALNAHKEHKSLIQQLSSNDLATAHNALSQLHQKDASFDGTLKKTKLWAANFEGADLISADLESASLGKARLQRAALGMANLKNANLWKANMEEAALQKANLEGAYLRETNLGSANLSQANLQKANFENATLQNANLRGANLRGANLWNVNLMNANLSEAIFDKEIILPDSDFQSVDGGEIIFTKYWTPDTDMRRYTDPKHPNFWQAKH